jgi:hypothetical protein
LETELFVVGEKGLAVEGQVVGLRQVPRKLCPLPSFMVLINGVEIIRNGMKIIVGREVHTKEEAERGKMGWLCQVLLA